MLTTKTLAISLLASSLTLLPQASQPPQDAPALGPDGLPVASASLRVEFEADLALADLLGAYSQATGVQIVMSPGVRERVEATTFAGFGGGLTLPPDELQGFVEGLLSRESFRLAMTNPGRVPVLTLLDARNNHPNADSPWLHISYDDVGHFADNSALLVETLVPVNAADARQLTNAIRMILNHPWSMAISMGSESSIFVRGTGTEVTRLVHSVLHSDRMHAGREAARAEAAKAAKAADAAQAQAQQHEVEAQIHAMTTGAVQVHLDPVASGLAVEDRPELEVRVFEIERDFRDVADVVKDLTSYRHGAEKQHQVWYQGDMGTLVPWPRPNFSYLSRSNRQEASAGGQLVVQATSEDLAWIEGTMSMVTGMTGSAR